MTNPPVLLGTGGSSFPTNYMSVGSAVPVGGLVVVAAGDASGAGTTAMPAVNDSRGNTYTVVEGSVESAMYASNVTTALQAGDTIQTPSGRPLLAAVYFPDGKADAATNSYGGNDASGADGGTYSVSTSAPVTIGAITALVLVGDDLGVTISITNWTILARYRVEPDTAIYIFWKEATSTAVQSASIPWPSGTGNITRARIAAFGVKGGGGSLTMLV